MTKKIIFLALWSLLLAPCSAVEAQQAGKVARIGYLDDSITSRIADRLERLRRELSQLGWNEGTNLTIESRFAEGKNDRLPELAADLVRLKVDLIVVTGLPEALAAKERYHYDPHRDDERGGSRGCRFGCQSGATRRQCHGEREFIA